MKDTINAALKAVLDSLQAGIDFAKAEIPLLLKEKLAYDFYSTGADLIFTILVLIVFIAAFKWSLSYYARTEHDRYEVDLSEVCRVVLTAATIIWGVVTIATLYTDVSTMIKIHLAPRLYLMEWLVSIVKK